MNSNKIVVLFLTVIFIQSTTWSKNKLTISPQVRIGLIDFVHNNSGSFIDSYTICSIPGCTFYCYLRPISINNYLFKRETSRLKYRLRYKYYFADNNFFRKFSLKNTLPIWHSHSLDYFHLINLQGHSIESLMKELSEYRNNTGLCIIENRDLKLLYYDIIKSQNRSYLIACKGTVVGLNMLSRASQNLNSQIHDQMKMNNGRYSWKEIRWGKVIASGVVRGLTSCYTSKKKNKPRWYKYLWRRSSS